MSSSLENRTLALGVYVEYYEDAMRKFDDISKYFSRYFKSVSLEEFSNDLISEFNISHDTLKDADLWITPMAMNLLTERVKTNFTAFGKPIGVNSLVMVSTPPRPISGSSAKFDVADEWTWFGIVASIIAVSLLLSIFKFYDHNSKKKIVMKTFCLVFLKYAWDCVMIIFCEPFEKVSKRVGPRIVCGIWILACVIIISEISAAMKSKYSFVEYDYPKSALDITPGSRRRLFGEREEIEILRLMSTNEPKLKYVVEEIVLDDYVLFYLLKMEGMIAFAMKNKFYEFLRMLLKHNPTDAIMPFHVSEPITEVYRVYPLSYEIAKDETFMKLLDFLILSAMETKWTDRFDVRIEFNAEKIKWRPPPPETNAISLKDLIPIFRLFLYGQLISASALLLEFGLARFTSGKLRF